ncbi:Chymotrypsin-elastase inhibitor ixodidin [Eumeta japonica]|uniref:Chymotrypsin-elastase inhibitor ixodidin n=1 Tax=Eumeta variegata TaxID=151549 RepID=A0A4C1UWN4_EUMVA|nr:Chymotrypsin-elastase inhibitor ixodidin [Eumeta japonica]
MYYNLLFVLCGAAVLQASFIVKDECGPNEEYQLCGSACPFNCSDPEGPVACSEECVEGCFCKAGFLKNENGTCVDEKQCTGGECRELEIQFRVLSEGGLCFSSFPGCKALLMSRISSYTKTCPRKTYGCIKDTKGGPRITLRKKGY